MYFLYALSNWNFFPQLYLVEHSKKKKMGDNCKYPVQEAGLTGYQKSEYFWYRITQYKSWKSRYWKDKSADIKILFLLGMPINIFPFFFDSAHKLVKWSVIEI